jgi:hypothetical protein
MARSVVERVAGTGTRDVIGTFYRHAAPNRDAFAGATLGRWGDNFPVIYLGRPPDSVTVEAYRHLVEPLGLPPTAVQPRTFYTVTVNARLVLDLTVSANRAAVGLTDDDLATGVDEYARCQEVARAAHRLQLHGILAPAATGIGETLALFARHLTADERPVVIEQVLWATLPADPRKPRAVSRSVRGGA